jgi:hypothetical protein
MAPAATEAPVGETAPAKASARRVKRTAAEPKRETREFASSSTVADNTIASVGVGVWPSELRDRVKNVLATGTKLDLAAEDFTTSEDFVTVADAARNTQVPFVVLKHRVLEEGRTLADAIHEFKPELNSKAEAARARAAAREDLETIG